MKKYELVKNEYIKFNGKKLYRIKALKDFGNVEVGDIGGYIESENNLSHSNNCWIYGGAEVWGNAEVFGDAKVWGNAEVWGDSKVFGNAEVWGDSKVFGNSKVCGYAEIKSKNDIITISNIGSRNSTTTFFRSKDNHIYVSCGCFYGNIKEFEEKVKNTHKGNKHEEIYLKVIELAKLQICGIVQNV